MQKKILIPILVVGALIVAAGFGSMIYGTVSASSSAGTLFGLRQGAAVLAGVPTGQGPVRMGMDGARGVSDQYLADALGITIAELDTAQQTAYEAALKQAVDQGLITQAQADEMKTNGSAAPFGGRWEGWLGQSSIDFHALLAGALGISVDQLNTASVTAHTARIDQAVTDGNLTQEQADLMKGEYALSQNAKFQSSMQSAYEAAVNQAVTDGVITQAQADQILANASQARFGGMGKMGGMGEGMGHGRGGRGGQGGGVCNQ